MAQDINQFSRRAILNGALGAMVAGSTTAVQAASQIKSDVAPHSLRESKQTPLGLYLTPRAAHRALLDNPEILFVDVRDPIEITFVGHPANLDKIIPLRTATHAVSETSGQYKMVTNRRLIADFERLLAEKGKTKSDPLFVTCRSGSRSAGAARKLIQAGFTNVWNLTEGFEGDKDSNGVRTRNGWRNAGLPWGYKLGKGVAWSG